MATTLSLVAIFAPVGFMSGMVGRFMQSFGLTMAFAVLVSLFVSFTLTPMMSARWLKVKPRTEDDEHHVHDSKHSTLFGPLDRAYTRMLDWAMAHRGLVAALAVLVLLSSVPLFRIVERQLHAAGRSVASSTSRCARPRAPASRRRTCWPTASATAIRQIPEVDFTLVTVAGDARRHAEHRVDVRAAASRSTSATAISSR